MATPPPSVNANGDNGAESGIPIIEEASESISRVLQGDVSTDALMNLWSTVGWPVTKALLLIIVALMLAQWAKKLLIRAATKARVEATLARFFGNIARWGVLVLAAIAILQTFGVETTSFAAVVAAMGFAVGLALSGTLGNVAAGVLLLIFRPFKVGDVISTNGVTATVHELELFSTTFDTFDNRRIIMPNGQIFGSTIENISHHKRRRVDVDVGVSYAASIDRTREVLTEAAAGLPHRLPDDPPAVMLSGLGDSSVNWSVRAWVDAADFWPAKDELTRRIKMGLDDAGLEIPFPQMDVHVKAMPKD
ncbi:MAG: mechanosensitive ion channel family protein [Phycisphaerales bacterium]|nr:MAG: mechanosensitive ion channel family protein [Phycisphaerales bacterium]